MPVVVPLRPLAGAPSSGALGSKQVFLENLKVFLTVLVVLHHCAITYGADGNWFYKEVNQVYEPDSLILTLLVAINQSFFMGFFFFISGCFVRSSLERKTAAQFLEDKFIRLAIPFMLFVLLVYPLIIWVAYYPHTFASFITGMPRLLGDLNLAHSGPTWFVLVLLVFNLVALVVRSPLAGWTRKIDNLNGAHLFAVSVATGFISFLTRLLFPDGFVLLNVQLSYLPQYAGYFIAGVMLAASGVVNLSQSQAIKPWLMAALICFFVIAIALGAVGDTAPFKGGFNPWAVLYSFVQGFHSVAFPVVLMVWFYRHANLRSWMRGIPGRAAYGAFFIHALVIVAIAIVMQPLVLPPLLKFLILAVLGVPASFALGYLLAKMPVLRKVF